MSVQLITPEWPAPGRVRALSTTRHGGVSSGVYASLNLAGHVGDQPESVERNRERLGEHLPMAPLWLEQVHGASVVNAASTCPGAQADAAVARMSWRICAVMTADCLPVLFCDDTGAAVGAAHAGWRGLAAGVLENTVSAMKVPPESIMAWLGPAISQAAFEVGDDVRMAFVAKMSETEAAFHPGRAEGKWQADLYQLARIRLGAIGVTRFYGGSYCTFSESGDFFSARRDGVRSGRQASLIWLE